MRTVDEVAAELQVSTDKLRAWMGTVRRAGGEVKALGAGGSRA